MKSTRCPVIFFAPSICENTHDSRKVGADRRRAFPGDRRNFREIQDDQPADLWDDEAVPTTALIVDDHPTFRRFARKLLESAGYLVVGEAEDGGSAVAAVGALRPDIVLLDVLLPDMTGFDVARELAAQPQRPLIVLTSSRSASDLGSLVQTEHAKGFISKRDLTVAAFAALVSETA
jgi:CheY-like chemotaxis protein